MTMQWQQQIDGLHSQGVQHMTMQWQQQIDAAKQYEHEAPVWRAWKLHDAVGADVYAFWRDGVVSVYSLLGIFQKSWHISGRDF